VPNKNLRHKQSYYIVITAVMYSIIMHQFHECYICFGDAFDLK